MATAPPRTSPATVLAEIRALANEFARDAHERRSRRELSRADFDRLGDAGFLLTAVPRDEGGLWEDAPRSIRQVSEVIRTLACSPYGFWLQDVRSLGYLRPTWGVAYDRLLEGSWALLD